MNVNLQLLTALLGKLGLITLIVEVRFPRVVRYEREGTNTT
jgi:hypothetical protein